MGSDNLQPTQHLPAHSNPSAAAAFPWHSPGNPLAFPWHSPGIPLALPYSSSCGCWPTWDGRHRKGHSDFKVVEGAIEPGAVDWVLEVRQVDHPHQHADDRDDLAGGQAGGTVHIWGQAGGTVSGRVASEQAPVVAAPAHSRSPSRQSAALKNKKRKEKGTFPPRITLERNVPNSSSFCFRGVSSS